MRLRRSRESPDRSPRPIPPDRTAPWAVAAIHLVHGLAAASSPRGVAARPSERGTMLRNRASASAMRSTAWRPQGRAGRPDRGRRPCGGRRRRPAPRADGLRAGPRPGHRPGPDRALDRGGGGGRVIVPARPQGRADRRPERARCGGPPGAGLTGAGRPVPEPPRGRPEAPSPLGPVPASDRPFCARLPRGQAIAASRAAHARAGSLATASTRPSITPLARTGDAPPHTSGCRP